ncbi:MAG: hypothetical protein KDK33_12200 [Leptospiraceae bacterium]|nr:hypothetical protein [Leptospiraceae bacterium]
MRRSTFLFSIIFALISCGGDGAWQIMKQDQQWMAQITRINLGPNEYFEGSYRYQPQKEGDRFVWVFLNLTNQQSKPIKWDHTKVLLKAGTASQDPFRVLQEDGKTPIKETETIPAGKSISRVLIYSITDSANPQSIVIGPLGESEIPESILFKF